MDRREFLGATGSSALLLAAGGGLSALGCQSGDDPMSPSDEGGLSNEIDPPSGPPFAWATGPGLSSDGGVRKTV